MSSHMAAPKPTSLRAQIRQSPPINLSIPYDPSWLQSKTILITGGASGFGAAFVREWARHGANIIIGDINIPLAESLVRAVRSETNNLNIHFVHCNVTDWSSQVSFFKSAIQLSPTGGVDTVVANAGIAAAEPLQEPADLSAPDPPKPNFSVIDVNLIGVLYTLHLAFFWLPRNPGSQPADPLAHPASRQRGSSGDRHILLLGSVASLMPLPGAPLYVASKHAVCGLFRTLRGSAFLQGVRINMLCPYYIDTPIVPTVGRVLLAGSGMGQVADVVDAATRFVADTRIAGRSLMVGPRVRVQRREDGEIVLSGKGEEGEERAVWEAYAEDYVEAEIMTQRVVRLLNAITSVRGWAGWAADLVKAAGFALRPYLGRFVGS